MGAVEESKRLLQALDQAQMPARHMIINQCSFLSANGGIENFAEAESAVAKVVSNANALGISGSEARSLRRLMDRLLQQHADARRKVTTLEEEVDGEVQVFRVPVFDEELTGVLAL